MATRVATPAGSTHSTRKLSRELWDLFLFYLRIFVVTSFLAAIVFCVYAALQSAKTRPSMAFLVVLGVALAALTAALLALFSSRLTGLRTRVNPLFFLLIIVLTPSLLLFGFSVVGLLSLLLALLLGSLTGLLLYVLRIGSSLSSIPVAPDVSHQKTREARHKVSF